MSAVRELFLGLDVGTTAAKASIFSLDGTVRLTAAAGYPLNSPRPGWHEQDPEHMAAGVFQAMTEVLSGVDADNVIGISISTAMHGLVGLDENMRPVTQLLTWADSRAAAQADELSVGAVGDRIHRISGTPIHAMSPLVKLRWIDENYADFLEKTPHWVGLKDWIILKLTGQLVTEMSTASGSGMANLRKGIWNPEALEIAGIREDQLPKIHDTTAQLPLSTEAAKLTGLKAGLPVVLGAGDGPLGNLGTGAIEPGVAGLSIGTSGALRMTVETPDVVPGLFCYTLTKDMWVSGGAISNGGMVQAWLTETFAPGANDAEACKRAAQVPVGAEGLRMIPYLVSERASLWDSGIRGAFLHVRKPHTPDHFIRAGIEGVALQLWTILRRLRTIDRISQVRATGGVFKSQIWCDVVAGILNRPLVITSAQEGSALGAAILGLYALGRVDSLHAGYEMLRVHEPPRQVEVSTSDVSAYEEIKSSMTPLLERYAKLAPLYDKRSGRNLAPGI